MLVGRYANYTDADTWYPSWGRDDKLYSPFTDTIGHGVNGVMARSDRGENAVVGHATMVGDDPMDLTVINPGTIPGPGGQYPGRYPCASLHHDGIWYIGTYGLTGAGYGGFNWPVLGPFGGFHISFDNGKTWTPSPLSTDVGNALFPEPQHFRGPVKMGSPHVVDFGKNMEHSPDGKMYLVAHGSTQMDEEERKANLSWITGDQIYLSRVKPSPETVNDESQYEYFAGHAADGTAVWSTEFADLKPIAEWNNNMGCVTITYNAPLKKFMMVVTDGWPTVRDMNTYILESDQITGPWKLVHYLTGFGPQGYFVNIPSKFISEDGRSAWLLFSANFAYHDIRLNEDAGTPVGSRYAMSWQEINLPETMPDLEEATLAIRPFTDAADIHLGTDGFKSVYAVNVSGGGTSPLSVNGVAFEACGADGTDVPGVTVTGKAVGNWGDKPEYGQGTDNDNLAAIMHDIRYADGTDTVTVSASVEPGRTYKLKLLFSENYYKEPGKRTFGFEINGMRFPRAFDVNRVTGPWSDNPAAGVVVEYEFVADDDSLRVVLSRGINAPDSNPILNAFTLSISTSE